ncbi:hypothetical protein BN1723_020276 [Verticillium longisporum]|uniref:Uncharacterized protein n=1 Tax=Verticillium longisporum TaxID=100787 RepID=A0A0G4NLQ8_VERLO|nr:hypothetical protein BN1723_020276 [Verticillium longisporum]
MVQRCLAHPERGRV